MVFRCFYLSLFCCFSYPSQFSSKDAKLPEYFPSLTSRTNINIGANWKRPRATSPGVVAPPGAARTHILVNAVINMGPQKLNLFVNFVTGGGWSGGGRSVVVTGEYLEHGWFIRQVRDARRGAKDWRLRGFCTRQAWWRVYKVQVVQILVHRCWCDNAGDRCSICRWCRRGDMKIYVESLVFVQNQRTCSYKNILCRGWT